MALVEGARFASYRIVRKLGEGGMGTVWEGVHEGLKKRVAIKTLHPTVTTHPEAVARFLREGEAAARLDHPHVVGVSDVGVHDNTPYLVMDFIEGESLAARIERGGALDANSVIEIALPVTDALSAAHGAGIVHRDLKPENILLKKVRGRALHPVLLDFGISKVEGTDARLTKTSAFMGTPYYMSPEQARGAKNVDARSDQYSFGLVLYEAASGKRAVEGESVFEIAHRISTGDIPSLDDVSPQLPKLLRATIHRMMATKADDRFSTLIDAGAALLPLASASTQAMWGGVFGAGVASAPTIAAHLAPPQSPSSTAQPLDLPTTKNTTTPFATPSMAGASLLSSDSSRPGRRIAVVAAALVVIVAVIGAGALVTLGSRHGATGTTPTAASAPTAPLAGSPADEPEIRATTTPSQLARGIDVALAPVRTAETHTPVVEIPHAPGDARGFAEHRVSATRRSLRTEGPSARGSAAAPDVRVDVAAAPPPPVAPPPPAPAASVAPTPSAAPPFTPSRDETAPHDEAALPDTPSRDAVAQAMQRVAPLARACGRIAHGHTTISFDVSGATGQVSNVHAIGAEAGSPVEQCLLRAFGAARFPRFARPTFSVSYPFTL